MGFTQRLDLRASIWKHDYREFALLHVSWFDRKLHSNMECILLCGASHRLRPFATSVPRAAIVDAATCFVTFVFEALYGLFTTQTCTVSCCDHVLARRRRAKSEK